MSFTEAVRSVYSKYATFEGRASRSEYWWFALFFFLVVLAFYLLMAVLLVATRSNAIFGLGGLALLVFYIASLVPSLSVLVRRLHDTDHSGWWFWITLVPFVGAIILFVFLVTGSTPGYNQFGPAPGQPMAERWAQYWGPTRADALRQFAEDAQRAATDGYQPVAQQWRWQGGTEVLDVGYSRFSAGAQWPNQPPGGYPPGG